MISWLGLAVPQFRENPIEAEVEFAEKGQIWIGYMPNLIPVDKEAYRMKRACLHNILMLFLPVALWGQFSIADLPKLKDYESERASSFDRSGGNHDYVAVDPGQTVTIFDHDGPGEIRHIWTTLPRWSEVYAHQKVVIRAYWDGEKDPSIEAPHKDPRWFNKFGTDNYVILDAEGDGQFVGVIMSVLNNQWGAWNEGDDMNFIDGEKTPRINGTGGEDYFNGA